MVILIFGLGVQGVAISPKDALFVGGNFQDVQDPLLYLIHMMERHPLWWKVIPNTMKLIQKKAEKRMDQKSPATLADFFVHHPPRTLEGWKLYHQVMVKNPSLYSIFCAQLIHLWTTREDSFSPQEQRDARVTFAKVWKPFHHHRRIEQLLSRRHLDQAKSLLQDLGLQNHDLGLACRFLDKTEGAVPAYSSSLKNKLVPTIAYIRGCIRTNQVEWALKAWKESRLGSYPIETKWVQDNLGSLEVSLMFQLLQSGQRLEVEGKREMALSLYREAMNLRKWPLHDYWTETLWTKGFIAFAGLRDFAKALPLFLSLTQEGKKDPLGHSAGLYPMASARYICRGLFWAGLCCEKLGKQTEARQYFQKAAKFGFYFYGQMAQYKLGLPITMTFSTADATKGLQSALQKEGVALAKALCATKREALKIEYAFGIDLIALAQTPADKKKLLSLIEAINPVKVTHVAKKFSTDPTSIFPQTYPTCALPRPARDPDLVYGVILAETCFDPSVISSAGAKGMMQIMPGEAAQFAKKANLPYRPQGLLERTYNMHLGIVELEDKLNRFHSTPATIAAYNAGPLKAEKWLKEIPHEGTPEWAWIWMESIPYAETRAYVPRVLEHRAVYRWLRHHPIQPSEVPSLLQLPCHSH